MYAACFNPRHGVRAKSKEGMVDLVICFECSSVELYFSEDETERSGADLSPSWRMMTPLTATLTRAGIEVLPDPWAKVASENRRKNAGR
jgi:hypothetical protein